MIEPRDSLFLMLWMFFMKYLPFLLAGMVLLLVVSMLAVFFWQRVYRDDEHNAIRRVLKNSAVPFVVRLLVRVLEFIFALVLYSTLAVGEIGQYTLAALLVAQYLVTLSEFGLGVLLTREVAKDQTAAPRLFGITLTLRWLLVAATVPIAALLMGVYHFLDTIGVGESITPLGQHVIWVLLLTLVPGAYSSAVTALFQASEQMEIPAFIELFTGTLSVLIRITLLLLGGGILGLAWTAVGVSTCTALLYFFLQNRYFFRPSLHWDRKLLHNLLPLAFPLMLNNLLNVVFFRFDMFLVKAFGEGKGDMLVQQYAVAYQFLNIALVLPPVITFAVFPMMARRATGDRRLLAHVQNRTLQFLLFLAFPIAMGISLLSHELVLLIVRRNVADYLPISAHVLSLLAWFLPLSFVNGLVQYVLIAINQQWVITRAFIIGALFNLIANLIMIPWFGLYAASVITILSEIVLFAVFLPILRREGLCPPLVRLAWQPAVATLAMGAAMFWAMQRGWGLAVGLAAPVYGSVLWLSGAIGPDERKMLAKLVKR
jgi:O-antigen/teichoic acid export membrane protein